MTKIIAFLTIVLLTIYSANAYDPEIYKAQQALSELGYSVGTADGIYGRKTKDALKQYQREQGIPTTGRLDANTRALLFKETKTGYRDPGGIAHVKNAYKKKHALVIGINAYPTMPLEAAVADARAVSKRLQELNFEVTTLLDGDASSQRIRSELGTRLARTAPDDQVLIYFAGHGVTERLHDKQLEGYILPVDVNLKDLYSTAISMKELRDLTQRIPAKHVLYVFDSCHSGLGLTRSTNRQNQDIEKYLTQLAGKRAAYMITAGKAGEVAREVGGHGVFTLHFLDGIAGAADSKPKDNVVQASELGIYLARAVSKDTLGEQNPQHGLFEGNGDFLFPLQDDDPIRLKQSQLAKLEFQSQELAKRKNLQAEFERLEQKFKESEAKVREEYALEIAKLDEQIREKQTEIDALSQAMPSSETDLNRSRYSVMKFLNTGVEFDILKTFPNLQEAEAYYSKVFGTRVDLDKAGYESDSERSILLSRKPVQLDLSGIMGEVIIETVTISDMLKNIQHISSPLRSDTSTFVKTIEFTITDIDKKKLTFGQIKARLIARYGKPTSKGDRNSYVIDWKTGKQESHNDLIWDDGKVSLTFGCGSSKIKTKMNDMNIRYYYSYNNYLFLSLSNQYFIFKSLNSQARKIADAEALVLEKKANQERLNF